VSTLGKKKFSAPKGCAILAAVIFGCFLLVFAVVGIQTWGPLKNARESMAELDKALGPNVTYRPAPSGEIPADRMEVFLTLRASLRTACDEYGDVQQGFDQVEALDAQEAGDLSDVGEVTVGLGKASLAITPFLARFFELRNSELLAKSMGLQEYSYIYATAYHDQLLSRQTRHEIFSDGMPLSPKASLMLQGCLSRQLAAMDQAGVEAMGQDALTAELKKMEDDPGRLIWQDGLPSSLGASINPYRERLDKMFCGATAGLEMEHGSSRALRVAIE